MGSFETGKISGKSRVLPVSGRMQCASDVCVILFRFVISDCLESNRFIFKECLRESSK